MAPLTADPASVSALGGLLVRTGVGWVGQADRLAALAAAGLGEGRPARAAAIDLDALAGRIGRLGEVARSAGGVLQSAATRLADTLDRVERLAHEATLSGLVVVDDVIEPAPGIRGLADAAEVTRVGAERERLQSRLDAVLAEADRDRRALVATIDEFIPAIDGEARALRLR